MERGAAGKK
jgi:hypothetical protein